MSQEITDHTDEALKLENQLCFPLYACARKVINLYTPYLNPLNLTYTQYIVLLVLWEQDNVKVGTLCEKLHLDNGTVTPLLKKLEEKGYVERKRYAKDERVVFVKLTRKGRDLKEKARDIPIKVNSCIKLEPEQTTNLYQVLYQLLDQE